MDMGSLHSGQRPCRKVSASNTEGYACPDDVTDGWESFGVGVRLTVAVMSDRYVEIILGALKQVSKGDLVVETTDVSTYIGGTERDILRYITDLSALIAKSEAHASITVHLFRGCPGAVACPRPGPRTSDLPAGRQVGAYAAAEWALYPLDDAPEADHMKDIYAAIDYAKKNGTYVESRRSVTRLEGDLGTILETVVAGWVQVGRSVQHVTSHITISVNSPSHKSKAP